MSKRIARQIGIRLTEEEIRRLEPLVSKVERKTYQCAPLSEIIKELIGLKPHRLTSESDRRTLLDEAGKLK